MNLSAIEISKIKETCKSYRVKKLYLFGSVLNNNFNKNSDIDMIVDFEENDPFLYSDLYFGLKSKLEELLKKPIDLLEERAIKNPFFLKTIKKSMRLIYG